MGRPSLSPPPPPLTLNSKLNCKGFVTIWVQKWLNNHTNVIMMHKKDSGSIEYIDFLCLLLSILQYYI